MPDVKITDLPFYPTVDGVDFSKCSVTAHQAIIGGLAPHNYNPIKGWLCRGRGSKPWTLFATNKHGKLHEVIDCQSMYSVGNAGHGNPDIIEPYIQFMRNKFAPCARAMDHDLHAPALTALKNLLGWNDIRIIFKSGGGEIIDTAGKMTRFSYYEAWHAAVVKDAVENAVTAFFKSQQEHMTRESSYCPMIIAARNSFHGRTVFATSFLEGEARHGFGPFPRVEFVTFGDIAGLEQVLRNHAGMVAAVLLEPIQGEGGIHIPPDDYLPRAEALCKKYGTLFILDGIQTDFGRTGKNFAHEHYDVRPDMLILGKALGAGLMPVSALVGRREVMDLLAPGTEGSTWSSAPNACLAVLLAIKELCDKGLAGEAFRKGKYFIGRLRALQKKHARAVHEVRGKGLLVALDLAADMDGMRFSELLLQNGVWAYPTHGHIIRFLPPLVISYEALDKAVNAVGKTLKALQTTK